MAVPKPRLSFAVGIIGQVPGDLPPCQLERITVQLHQVFGVIEQACARQAERHPGRYCEKPPLLRLVATFAGKADELAFKALPPCWCKAAILPADVAAQDGLKQALGGADTVVAELPNDKPDEAKADAEDRAGRMMLRQIDLLIAVWDGGDTTGRIDSPYQMAKLAFTWAIPVVRIAVTTNRPPLLLPRLDANDKELGDARAGPLADVVEAALATIDDPRELRSRNRGGSRLRRPDDRLAAFLNEVPPTRCVWAAYKWLTLLPKFWLWRFPLSIGDERSARDDWRGFLSAMPAAAGLEDRLDKVLLPRFAAADACATWYAHAYRSAYVLAYVLSVGAVAAALLGFMLHGEADSPSHILRIKAILVGFEAMMVFGIIAIVGWGQIHKWHDRWLDYRALAETLRHLRILGPLGQYEPSWVAGTAARPGAAWIVWYLRATMRELGTPRGCLDGALQHCVLTAIKAAEIESQIAYNDGNRATLERLHRRLHRTGDWCFIITGIVLVGFLLLVVFNIWLKPNPAWLTAAFCFNPGPDRPITRMLVKAAPWIGLVATLLPALGAAVAGIRFTGDFEGFAERSAETAEGLRELRKAFDAARNRLVFDDSASVLIETARLMATDLTGWRTLYGRKHLTLPA